MAEALVAVPSAGERRPLVAAPVGVRVPAESNEGLRELVATIDLSTDGAAVVLPVVAASTQEQQAPAAGSVQFGEDVGPTADVDDCPPDERTLSPFCFVDSIRQFRSVATIEIVRKRLGARHGAEGAYTRADALKYAVLYGHSTYSAWLLREHAPEALAAPVCCPLLLTAVRLDRADVVEQLCRLSRQVKRAVPYIDSRGCASMESRRTALHVAAEMSSVTIVNTLLRYGANSTIRDQFGLTPLDRVLHALPVPHINFNTVRLARELLRCLPALNDRTSQAWQALVARNPSWAARLPADCRHLVPGPFSLMHIARVAVRRAVGYPRLPDGVYELPVPPVLQRFINLEW